MSQNFDLGLSLFFMKSRIFFIFILFSFFHVFYHKKNLRLFRSHRVSSSVRYFPMISGNFLKISSKFGEHVKIQTPT